MSSEGGGRLQGEDEVWDWESLGLSSKTRPWFKFKTGIQPVMYSWDPKLFKYSDNSYDLNFESHDQNWNKNAQVASKHIQSPVYEW